MQTFYWLGVSGLFVISMVVLQKVVSRRKAERVVIPLEVTEKYRRPDR